MGYGPWRNWECHRSHIWVLLFLPLTILPIPLPTFLHSLLSPCLECQCYLVTFCLLYLISRVIEPTFFMFLLLKTHFGIIWLLALIDSYPITTTGQWSALIKLTQNSISDIVLYILYLILVINFFFHIRDFYLPCLLWPTSQC